jgi:hypothetical protein
VFAAAHAEHTALLPCQWNYQINGFCRCPGRPRIVHALTSVGAIGCLGVHVKRHVCESPPGAQNAASKAMPTSQNLPAINATVGKLSSGAQALRCPSRCHPGSCPIVQLSSFGATALPNQASPSLSFHASTARVCGDDIEHMGGPAPCAGCDGQPYSGITSGPCEDGQRTTFDLACDGKKTRLAGPASKCVCER